MPWYNKHRTIGLDLDLNVLLYYSGLRSVYDIYRLQSAHTKNNREPGVHCNKKRHQWHQIMPFIFTWPKFQAVYFLKCSSFWGTSSPRPPDLAPTPPSRSAPGTGCLTSERSGCSVRWKGLDGIGVISGSCRAGNG